MELAICFVSVMLFNNSNASIENEQDFHWSLVKLSAQVDLSSTLYKYRDHNDKPWYMTEQHMKNIMEEIPNMIADCALKRGVFANVKDGIVRFQYTDISSYTDANKNAYLIYNYIYNQMHGSKLSVAEVAEILSEDGEYDFNKSISCIKTYIMDLHLNKDYTKYTDINKIPNIKIERINYPLM